jgi:hypothetical protein
MWINVEVGDDGGALLFVHFENEWRCGILSDLSILTNYLPSLCLLSDKGRKVYACRQTHEIRV